MKSLGADEVVDYKRQEFETVLHGYDMVLGTIRGDSIEKSLNILKPKSIIVSLIGPFDAAFARSRRLNALLRLVLSLMSWKIRRLAKKHDVHYSSLFVHPDGEQLAEIARIIDAGSIRPVIDRVYAFDQAKEALAYLDTGRAKGKVVVKMI